MDDNTHLQQACVNSYEGESYKFSQKLIVSSGDQLSRYSFKMKERRYSKQNIYDTPNLPSKNSQPKLSCGLSSFMIMGEEIVSAEIGSDIIAPEKSFHTDGR